MDERTLAIVQGATAGVALAGTVLLAALRVPIPDVLTHIDYALAGSLLGGAVALPFTTKEAASGRDQNP
jgi:hypothetical protein